MEARYYLIYKEFGKETVREFKTPERALLRTRYPHFKTVEWSIVEEIMDENENVLSLLTVYSSNPTYKSIDKTVDVFIKVMSAILLIIIIIFVLEFIL